MMKMEPQGKLTNIKIQISASKMPICSYDTVSAKSTNSGAYVAGQGGLCVKRLI